MEIGGARALSSFLEPRTRESASVVRPENSVIFALLIDQPIDAFSGRTSCNHAKRIISK